MSKKFNGIRTIMCLITYVILLFPLLLPAQHITSFAPLTGYIGTPVTITGTGFDLTPGNNVVHFGATSAVVVSASVTQLVVKVPPGATYQPISVTKGGQTAYSSRYFTPTFGCAATAFPASVLSNKVDFYAGYYSSPISTVIADFDGDGKPDIACTDQDSYSITVFRNIGTSSAISNASFAPGINFYTDSGPSAIIVTDMDGDGKPDIAITTASSTVSVFRNTSVPGSITSSSFASSVSFLTSTGPADFARTANISAGDLDGDGKPDLAVTNPNKSTISIFRNTSVTGTINSGSFAARLDLAGGSTPLGIVITDFDGDGKPDIAVNNAQGFNVSVYHNNSTPGTLTAASFGESDFSTGIGTITLGIAAGDLNNDGKPELIVPSYLANQLLIFPNTVSSPGTVSFGSSFALSTPNSPVSPVVGDFNGDGKPDIALSSYDYNAANSVSNPLSLFVNNISGITLSSSSFMPRVDVITGGSLGYFAIGDLDGDGKPEFVIPNYSSDLISVVKNNTTIFATLPPATINGLNAVCDDGVWKNYYDPANTNKIICSIRDNGNNLGSTNARVYVDAAPSKYNTTSFLSRHFLITPTSQPTSGIQVRLYFTQAEFAALQVADNRLSSPDDLSITKYQGPTEDGIFNPADATSISIIPASSIVYGSAFGGYYADFTVTGLSELWFNYGNVALPIQLLNFKAEKQDNAVSLQWSTASEINNDYFTIERSADGTIFTAIGSVKANGTSSLSHSYEIKDVTPLNGLNYYRLKQTDKDDKSSYSAVLTVEWNGAGGLKVMIAPMPMITQSTINFQAKSGKTNFSIYNSRGAMVQTYNVNRETNGNAQLIITKGALTPGIYFYKIFTNNQEVYHGKLVVE